MTNMDLNAGHIARAVSLAFSNAESGQLPFGAVVVMDDAVVGSGVNTTLRYLDPTGHAEVEAVRDACKRLGRLDLSGAFIAASCEPCPMCQTTALMAGIQDMIYAATKQDAESYGFELAEVPKRVQNMLRALLPDALVPWTMADSNAPFARYNEIAAASGHAIGEGTESLDTKGTRE